jgi:hypothetical protein
MVIIDRGTVSVDGPPTPDDVLDVWQRAGAPSLAVELVADLLAAIDNQARLPGAAKMEAGGLVRLAVRRGVPVARGTAGLPGPTARNWCRGLIAACTGGDVGAAIGREQSLQLQPAQGLASKAPRPAPAAAPQQRSAPAPAGSGPSADELTQVLKIRFKGFPERPSEGARDAVRRWEQATGQVYSWPDATPLAMRFAHPVPDAPPPAFVAELHDDAGDRSGLDAILADLEATRGELFDANQTIADLREEFAHADALNAELRDELAATNRELSDARLQLEAVVGEQQLQKSGAQLAETVNQRDQARAAVERLRAAATHAADLLAGAAANFTPSAKREPQQRLHAAAVDAEQVLRDITAPQSPSP